MKEIYMYFKSLPTYYYDRGEDGGSGYLKLEDFKEIEVGYMVMDTVQKTTNIYAMGEVDLVDFSERDNRASFEIDMLGDGYFRIVPDCLIDETDNTKLKWGPSLNYIRRGVLTEEGIKEECKRSYKLDIKRK